MGHRCMRRLDREGWMLRQGRQSVPVLMARGPLGEAVRQAAAGADSRRLGRGAGKAVDQAVAGL